MKAKTLQELGTEVGALVTEKNAAYGNSFELSKNIIHILFPNGVPKEKYQDLLTITRVIDKLFRIATRKDAFGENPWKDIAGYAVLAMWNQQDAIEKKNVMHPDNVAERERKLYTAMDAIAHGKGDRQQAAKACMQGKWVYMSGGGNICISDSEPGYREGPNGASDHKTTER